jgi:anti-sigma B factor antagonist
MSLDISQREREGVVILGLRGRLTAGEEASILREKVKDLAAGERTRVVLDLKEVDYIDSTGLGSLMICFTTVKKAGGMMKLLNLSRRNVELLVLTKLTTVFEMFADEQDAVNSFFPGRKITPFDILAFVQQSNEQAE